MDRAQLVALLASAYLVFVFVRYRSRLYRRRGAGPRVALLRRFDYRVVWGQLEPLYRAGLRGESAAPAPHADAQAAPSFYASSPWEVATPAYGAALRDALMSGATPAIDVTDPAEQSLFVHFFLRRLLGGDLAGAAEAAARLPEERALLLLATIELARAERLELSHEAAGARAAARTALGLLDQIRAQGRSCAADYLAAHLRLCWLVDAANLEWVVLAARFRLGRALKRWGESPCLYLARAHASALLGRQEESLDDLGRALYYARGDVFYARNVLEDDFVAQRRPALLAQCRTLSDPAHPRTS